MNKIASEIMKEVTPEQEARLKKIENLMGLNQQLQHDQESILEQLTETIEQRHETCLALGVDMAPLNAVLKEVENAFETLRDNAQKKQYETMKNG